MLIDDESAPRPEWSSFFALGKLGQKIAGMEGGNWRPNIPNDYSTVSRVPGTEPN